ncbi:MAG: extracellular solute-binding protein [Ruminococcaceae bacterium]|nr:extracellular solute-binding protein [Oscillospiraceae bacterium]
MKKLFTLFLAVVTLFSLCSCHGALVKDSGPEKEETPLPVPPEEFDTSRDFEITFWAKNDTNKTQVAIYEKTISDFEKIYPNISVKLRLYTDYGKIYNDVITNIATKTTPDVCITYPDHIATYLSGENIVVPLDTFINDEKYGLGGSGLRFDSPEKDEVVEKFLDEGKISGVQYALPFMRSTEALYVNKTYVEKLGFELPETVTWDFIFEVCEKAVKKDDDGIYEINGKKRMIPFIYKSTDNMMIQLLKQRNAGFSTDRGDILIFNDDCTDILLKIAKETEKGLFSTFKISGYPANLLNAGECIFAVDSTAGATWMGTDAPLIDIAKEKLVEFETVVLPVPQIDPKNPVMISQGPSVCIFNKDDPQRVLASFIFTQYLLTNEVQIAYSGTEGYLPVTNKALSSEEYTDYLSRSGEDNEKYYDIKITASKLLMDNIGKTFVTPVFNGSASLRDVAGQLIENVTKSVNRKEIVDKKYIDDLYDDMISLHRLDKTKIKNERFLSANDGIKKLPVESKALIILLCTVWLFLILYFIYETLKKRKK